MSKFARTALEKNEVNEQEWLRPPYLQTYEFSDEPLYVLPAFLSRADSSPLSERRRDPNNNESEYYTCLNYNIINRLYPEVATRR